MSNIVNSILHPARPISSIKSLNGLLTYSTSSSTKKWIDKNYRRHIGGQSRKGDQAEKEAYIALHERLLDREIRKGVINPGDQDYVKDLEIFYREQMAQYTNPNTGLPEAIDLQSIEDKNLRKSVKLFMEESGAVNWQKNYTVSRNSKGNPHGKNSLQKTTHALQKLPNDHEEIQKEFLPDALQETSLDIARSKKSARLLFSEYFLIKWKEKIQEKISEREKLVKQNTNPILLKEISQLKNLLTKIDGVDLYALSRALTYFPIGSPLSNHIDAVARDLEKKLEEEILTHTNRNWKRPLKGKQLSEEDYAYIQDVKGLLYLDRISYFNFCDKNFIEKKKEGITELLMKEAVDFSTRGKNYKAEGIKNSILFENFDPSLREEMAKILNAIAVTASHTVKEEKLNEYKIPASDPKASEAEIKAQKAKNKTILCQGIQEHRNSIDYTLTADKVPPSPKNLSNRVIDFGKTIVKVGVPIAAATGAAYYTGYLTQQRAIQLSNMIIGGPGKRLVRVAGINFAYNLSTRIYSYLRPQKRNEFGEEVTRTNWGRVAKLTGIVGVAALTAYTMDPVTTQSISATAISWGGSAVEYVWNSSLSTMFSLMFARYVGQKLSSKTPESVKMITGAAFDTAVTVNTVSNTKKTWDNNIDWVKSWGNWAGNGIYNAGKKLTDVYKNMPKRAPLTLI